MNVLMGVAVTLTCALVLFLIVYILYKGLPNITWELLSTSPSYLSGTIGILPDILNTVYLVLATLVFVLPLGVGAAIYLTEYAKNKRIVAIIEYAAETLSGIPSIIYGLVGMLFFCQFLGFQTSIIAGALTLVIMNLPTVMRTTHRSAELPRRRFRAGRRQMESYPNRCFAGLYRRCYNGLYPFRRTNPRRIRGSALHGGSSTRRKRAFRGARKFGSLADSRTLRLCKRAR